MQPVGIHDRVLLTSDGGRHVRSFVRCPADGRWALVAECARCAECLHASMPTDPRDGLVLCARGDAIAERTRVAGVLERNVLCAREGVSATAVAEAMEKDAAAMAIVVDGDGCPVGVVTSIDLEGAAEGARACDVMTPFAVTLLEDAPVSEALALLADGGMHAVPVLSGGKVVGIVTPRSIAEAAVARHAACSTRHEETRP